MRAKLYLLLSLFLAVSACKSVEKLVDEGRYDEAIVIATKKLAGKKNKKTKHIRALEEAFAKVHARDLNYISTLKQQGYGPSWMRIYDHAWVIERRQEQIKPFLPLVSKDGYAGYFELIDTAPIIQEAGQKAAAYWYDQGTDALTQARTHQDKKAAQDAYHAFEKIEKYSPDYKDTEALKLESRHLGIYHVLLRWDESFYRHQRASLISFTDINRLNDFWIHYHMDFSEDIAFDAVSTFAIEEIDISRERETINNFVVSKDLESWLPERDQNGNEVRDTSGNVVQIRQIETVRAQLTDILRTKSARVVGTVTTVDYHQGKIIDRDEFIHDINFESDACDMQGDRRALEDNVIKRLDLVLRPFPTDYEMVREGIETLESNFLHHVGRIRMTDLEQVRPAYSHRLD